MTSHPAEGFEAHHGSDKKPAALARSVRSDPHAGTIRRHYWKHAPIEPRQDGADLAPAAMRRKRIGSCTAMQSRFAIDPMALFSNQPEDPAILISLNMDQPSDSGTLECRLLQDWKETSL
jgi:hypothetical protein